MREKLRRYKGFTIVEMLVVCSVFIVILSLLADVFIQCLQRTNDGRIRVDMQQRAVFAINRWEKDLERTSQSAMRIKPGDPFCVAMTPAAAINQYGSITWEPSVTCWAYSKGDKTWQRESYPGASGGPSFSGAPSETLPYLPTFSELDSLFTHKSGDERIMCENVDDFSLTDRNGNTDAPLSQPLIFRLKLRRTLSTSQRVADFTVERRYTLRNNF